MSRRGRAMLATGLATFLAFETAVAPAGHNNASGPATAPEHANTTTWNPNATAALGSCSIIGTRLAGESLTVDLLATDSWSGFFRTMLTEDSRTVNLAQGPKGSTEEATLVRLGSETDTAVYDITFNAAAIPAGGDIAISILREGLDATTPGAWDRCGGIARHDDDTLWAHA